jgi:hypothetical protein
MGYNEQNDDLHSPHASATNDSHGETECPDTQPMKIEISTAKKSALFISLFTR